MNMPERIDPSLFAPCGMNCLVCYKHCNARKPCAGCLSGDQNKPAHCRKCAIKDCVRERGLSLCYECEVFPCKRIKNLEKSYQTRYGTSLVAFSRFAAEYGLSAFMEAQKKRYTCRLCGGVISLHDAACSTCGGKYPSKGPPD